MKKTIVSSVFITVGVLTLPMTAFAHVIVTPDHAGVGQELTFDVSVPNERNTAVTNVRLAIPAGVDDVTPTVTPGWTIATTGSSSAVSAITWAGIIPVGQREDFSFSAQVPATATQLHWKAYQTYADGTVIHWDQTPHGSDDASGAAGPYSVTSVVNDLSSSSTDNQQNSSSKATLALIFSVAALALSIGGLFIRRRP